MSEFSSLLASFKRNTAAASSTTSTSSSSKSSNNISSSRGSAPLSSLAGTGQERKQQYHQSRKRPHLKNNGNSSNNAPSTFPSFRDQKSNSGFELSFLVIGAQKAGTSWLHAMLLKCCDAISLPEDRKEVHFWDWHFRKGFDWYVRQFDFPPERRRHRSGRDDDDDPRRYGEITPCYAVLPPPAIAEIRKCFPRLKVIFVARDLVDRAWSAMIMELRDQTMGLNAGEFAGDSSVVAGRSVGKCGERESKRARKSVMSVAQQRRLQEQSRPSSQPDSYYLDRLRDETHSSRSDYATGLRNWYAHFPQDSMLIVDYEEIEKRPRDVLLRIVTHIGLEESEGRAFVGGLSDEEVNRRVNAATNVDGCGMKSDNAGRHSDASSSQHSLSQRPKLRRQMEALLRPHATRFNLLLKERGYSWRLDEYSS